MDGPGVLRLRSTLLPHPPGTSRSVVRAGAPKCPRFSGSSLGGLGWWWAPAALCLPAPSPDAQPGGCGLPVLSSLLEAWPATPWCPLPSGVCSIPHPLRDRPKPQSQPSSPVSWRSNLRPRGEGLRAAAVGMPRTPEQSTPPPSRNQFPKHPACGLLTPWLPGLEEGPLSHETSIRCPLIGTQSACSSLERAGHKLEETTPGPGGAVHRGPRRGLGAQGRQTLLRGSVARKDSEEAAGGAMGPGDGR